MMQSPGTHQWAHLRPHRRGGMAGVAHWVVHMLSGGGMPWQAQVNGTWPPRQWLALSGGVWLLRGWGQSQNEKGQPT